MTRIVYIPDSSRIIHLETTLAAPDLVTEVAAGRWRPPLEIHSNDETAPLRLRAVRLGRATVLIFRLLDPSELEDVQQPESPLSRRQLAVLQCLVEGLAVKQICRRLGLSERTVFLHLAALKKKLRVLTTAQAVTRAVELGLCISPAPTPRTDRPT